MGGVTLFNQHLFMKRERKQLQLREDKDKKSNEDTCSGTGGFITFLFLMS